MALGKSNKEVGQVLYISEYTVKNHVRSIFKKAERDWSNGSHCDRIGARVGSFGFARRLPSPQKMPDSMLT